MFTGLIQEVGTILSVTQNTEGKEFVIKALYVLLHGPATVKAIFVAHPASSLFCVQA